ncbi:Cytochrome P450 71A26 [Zea mays]|uniref:Cytochrome P450 71A26 n=1 Tax=Zea mays TaxID=4577 RepID=A0A1D6FH14_MAIZE|nr:Cytochrome P450 71A26 [Zea mays]
MLARVRAAAGGRDGAVVNLTAHIISYTNGIISRATYGDKGGRYYDGPDGGEKLAKLFADFEELLGTVTVGEFVPWLAWVDALMGLDAKATRTSAELDAFLERVITDHRRQRRRGGQCDGDDHRDFVDVLLDVNEDEADAGGGVKLRRDHQGHYPENVCRRHGHDLHDAGMGHGGAHQPHTRDAQGPGRDPRRRRHRRRPRHRGPPRGAALPQVRDQGDAPAAHAAAAPHTTGDDGGHGAARLPRPSGHPRHRQRLGHRAGRRGVGARRRVRAGAVCRRRRPQGGGLLVARAGLQVRAVWRREERVPWGGILCADHGAGAGELALSLRLGAAGSRAVEAGDGRAERAVRAPQGQPVFGC